MNPENKWLKIAGIVLNVLIGGLMIFSASGKVFGSPPPEVAETIAKYGLTDVMQLIGVGEMIAALLLILPWTSPLGTLVTSGFWGGAICIHMAHREPYAFQSALLVTTWVGSYLRGSVPLFWIGRTPTA